MEHGKYEITYLPTQLREFESYLIEERDGIAEVNKKYREATREIENGILQQTK